MTEDGAVLHHEEHPLQRLHAVQRVSPRYVHLPSRYVPHLAPSMDELEDCLTQVHRMALAAMHGFTYWLYTRPDNNIYGEIIQKYGNFFYPTSEAHLGTMFISIDILYDNKQGLMNFVKLMYLIKDKVDNEVYKDLDSKISKLRSEAKKIGIIRNHFFAHVTSYEVRSKMYEKYAQSQGDYTDISFKSLVIATKIAHLLEYEIPSAREAVDESIKEIKTIYSMLGYVDIE